MGVGPGSRSSSRLPRRAYYPSGPWIDGIRPSESVQVEEKPRRRRGQQPTGNPDPSNYQIVRAEEKSGYLIVQIKYPDCTNFEGNKILMFRDLTLIQLVNQKLIDPHFFPSNKDFHSPVARFVPTDEGWAMALALAGTLGQK